MRQQANGVKRILNRICRVLVLPVLGGKAVEGQQMVSVLGEARGGLVIFGAIGLDEEMGGGLALLPAASGEAFSGAVEMIERFLVPCECWSMLYDGLNGDDGEASKVCSIG